MRLPPPPPPTPTPHAVVPCTPLQASFHVFGMELLATLDVAATNEFFGTFFRLPPYYWRGFLASTLTATDLISFAAVVFVLAPPSIKYKLMEHLITGEGRGGEGGVCCCC